MVVIDRTTEQSHRGFIGRSAIVRSRVLVPYRPSLLRRTRNTYQPDRAWTAADLVPPDLYSSRGIHQVDLSLMEAPDIDTIAVIGAGVWDMELPKLRPSRVIQSISVTSRKNSYSRDTSRSNKAFPDLSTPNKSERKKPSQPSSASRRSSTSRETLEGRRRRHRGRSRADGHQKGRVRRT